MTGHVSPRSSLETVQPPQPLAAEHAPRPSSPRGGVGAEETTLNSAAAGEAEETSAPAETKNTAPTEAAPKRGFFAQIQGVVSAFGTWLKGLGTDFKEGFFAAWAAIKSAFTFGKKAPASEEADPKLNTTPLFPFLTNIKDELKKSAPDYKQIDLWFGEAPETERAPVLTNLAKANGCTVAEALLALNTSSPAFSEAISHALSSHLTPQGELALEDEETSSPAPSLQRIQDELKKTAPDFGAVDKWFQEASQVERNAVIKKIADNNPGTTFDDAKRLVNPASPGFSDVIDAAIESLSTPQEESETEEV